MESHPFGEPVPGEAVASHGPGNPTAGYIPRRRWARLSSGKPVCLDNLPQRKEALMSPTAVAGPPAPDRIMTVYDCIVAVSREIAQEGISKNRSNAQQGYKFRGIDDVLNALSPLLAKYRLVILPRILSRLVVERTTQKGGVLFYVTVEAEFDFVSAADGSIHTVKTYGEAMDSADKATNKAMSAAYKYAAFQTFCIPTEGDNDADAVTHDLRPAAQPTPERLAQVAQSYRAEVQAIERTDDGPNLGTAEPDDLPEGFRLIDDYKIDGDWHHVSWGRDAQGGWMLYKTKLASVGQAAREAFASREPVKIHSKKLPWLDKVERLGITRAEIDGSRFRYDPEDGR